MAKTDAESRRKRKDKRKDKKSHPYKKGGKQRTQIIKKDN